MTISKLINEPKILNNIVSGLNHYDLERTELASQSLYRYAHLEKVKRAYAEKIKAKTIKQFDRLSMNLTHYTFLFLELRNIFACSLVSKHFKAIIVSPTFFKMRAQQAGVNLLKDHNFLNLRDALEQTKYALEREYQTQFIQSGNNFAHAVVDAIINHKAVPEALEFIPQPSTDLDSLFEKYVHSLAAKSTEA